MSLLDKYSEEIDAYVQNRMTEKEKNDFEVIISEHEEIKLEINELKSMFNSYSNREVYNLKKRLDSFEKAKYSRKFGIFSETRTYHILIAAIFVGVIMAITIFYSGFETIENESLIVQGCQKDYFKNQIENIEMLRGKNNIYSEFTIADTLFIDLMTWSESLNSKSKDLKDFISQAEKLLSKKDYITEYEVPSKIVLSKAYLLKNKREKARKVLFNLERNEIDLCEVYFFKALSCENSIELEKIKKIVSNFDCYSHKMKFEKIVLNE